LFAGRGALGDVSAEALAGGRKIIFPLQKL